MTHVTDLPIVILAAGASSRMGGVDKLMQQVDGRPLIRRQADLACAVTSGTVLIALPPPPHPRYQALSGVKAVLLPVLDADEGMNASLRAAFGAVPRDAEAAILLLADLPDITTDDIATLIAARRANPDALIWRGATEDGQPGHPMICDGSLFNAFQALAGDGGGQAVVTAAGGNVVTVRLPGQNARRDLDTPQDWDAWRADNPLRG